MVRSPLSPSSLLRNDVSFRGYWKSTGDPLELPEFEDEMAVNTGVAANPRRRARFTSPDVILGRFTTGRRLSPCSLANLRSRGDAQGSPPQQCRNSGSDTRRSRSIIWNGSHIKGAADRRSSLQVGALRHRW